MNSHNPKPSSLVDQYLNALCFNKISESNYKRMLCYESKADPVERKLIKRIKDQVSHGKLVFIS